MRLAAIQMNSGADVDANLRLTDRLLSDAAADDCKMAVLPENFALMPKRSRDKVVHAEEPGSGPIPQFPRSGARRHGPAGGGTRASTSSSGTRTAGRITPLRASICPCMGATMC